MSYVTVGLSLAVGAWLTYSPHTRQSRAPYICLGLGLLALSLVILPLNLHLYGAVAGICALFLGYSGQTNALPPKTGKNSTCASVLPLVLITLIGALLFHRLDTYSSKPLVWEAVVIENVVSSPATGSGFIHSFTSRLLWSEGLLSEGDRSLLYGFPITEILPRFPSMFAARLPAAIITIGSLVALYGLLRSHVSPTIATIAVGVFGLNELVLIFGRTGGSIAGTLFSLLVALWAYLRYVDIPSKRNATLAALCLFMATLGYAPARLVVVWLTLLLLGEIIVHKKLSLGAKFGSLIPFLATVAICVIPQFISETYWLFASARLEHLPGMFLTGYWPDHMLDQWNEVAVRLKPISLTDVTSFSKTLLESVTLPNLATVISPYAPQERGALPFFRDPLFLKIFAPGLFPFLVLGMFAASHSHYRVLNRALWTWTIGIIPFLLLTNRVDSYRASPLIIPCAIWISFGVAQAIELLNSIPFSRVVASLCVCGAIYLAAVPRLYDLSRLNTDPLPSKQVLDELNGLLSQPPVLGVEYVDFRVRAEMLLDSLARQQKGILLAKELLDSEDYLSLAKNDDAARQLVAKRLRTTISMGTPLILGPTYRFQKAASNFMKIGLSVQTLRLRELSAYLITSPSYSHDEHPR